MIYLSKKEVNKCKSFLDLMDLIIDKSEHSSKKKISKKSKGRSKNEKR